MTRWVNKLRWMVAGIGAVALGSTNAGQALAQEGALTELYGYGVHRYYAGDYQEAQRALNIVIDAGIEDPRPHYFRGLVTYQMGMPDAAKSDFEHAADLEARGKGTGSIGRALERIQGPVRRDIESARLAARVAVALEQRAKKEMDAAQSQTSPNIAKPPTAPTEALPPAMSEQAPAAPNAPPPVTPDALNDPFKDDAVPAPAPATEPPTDDPFGAPAAPATEAPAADPFGDAPAAPAAPAGAVPDPFQ